MTTQPKPNLDELEALAKEVDRLHGHFVDGGCKSMGVAQQLTYAEEALGAKMVEHRLSLIAAARELESQRWVKATERAWDEGYSNGRKDEYWHQDYQRTGAKHEPSVNPYRQPPKGDDDGDR